LTRLTPLGFLVDGQVPLATYGPRSKVIKSTNSRGTKDHAVDGCLENFAAAGAEKRKRPAHIARQES
jgi:hypothetical protein